MSDKNEVEIVKTECSKGAFAHFADDLYIPESLRKYDGWENEVYEACKQYIKPTSNIIEVGAHIGTHTVPFSKLTNRFVFAFEMQRMIGQILNTNIIMNNCRNVVVYNEIVSDQDGSARIADLVALDGGEYNSGNAKVEKILHKKGHPIRVSTLDKKFEGFDNIDLIKIDVECHEVPVLKGALNIIKKNKPVIVTEYHTKKTEYTNGNQDEIKALLPDYDWKELVGHYYLNNKEVYNFNMIGVPK